MKQSNTKVNVQYLIDPVALPTEAEFGHWVNVALQSRNKQAEICIRIVDLEESENLNWQYRQKQSPTNILSFPADLPEYLDHAFIGDLVICAPLVNRQAKEQNKKSIDHWAHLIIHGVLHLLQYDHDTPSKAREMEIIEIQLLADLGVADPYSAQLSN